MFAEDLRQWDVKELLSMLSLREVSLAPSLFFSLRVPLRLPSLSRNRTFCRWVKACCYRAGQNHPPIPRKRGIRAWRRAANNPRGVAAARPGRSANSSNSSL